MLLAQPRPRGRLEQHGRRPVSRGAVHAASNLQEPGGSGWSFWAKQVDARASIKLSHRRASARRAVSSLSNVVWSLIGCPPSKDGRTSFRRLGKSKAQKSGRSRDRSVAGLQPGQRSRCLYATNDGGRKQSPLARPRLVVAEGREDAESCTLCPFPAVIRPHMMGRLPAYCPGSSGRWPNQGVPVNRRQGPRQSA